MTTRVPNRVHAWPIAFIGILVCGQWAEAAKYCFQDDDVSAISSNWLGVSPSEITSVLQQGRNIDPQLFELRKWWNEEHLRLQKLFESGQIDGNEFTRLYKQLELENLQKHEVVVPPEQLLQAVHQAILNRLVSYLRHGGGNDDLAFLGHEKLADRLELNADQKARLRSLRDSFSRWKTKWQEELSDELSQLYREHCQKAVAVLESHQRDRFNRLIGQPIAWFRIPPKSREALSDASIGLQYGQMSSTFTQGDVRKANEKRLQHNRESGDDIPERIDYVLMVFLQDGFFLEELDLADEQAKSIKGFVRNVRDFCEVGSADHNERTAALFRGDAMYPKPVMDALLPRQTEWLRQTELQVRLAYAYTSCGLLSEELSREIGLSSKQRDQIADLTSEFEQAANEKRKAHHERFLAEAQSCFRSMLDVLTPSQRKMYAELVGIDRPILEENERESSNKVN
ncbi:MAG TPA: hypothetical protein PKD54_08960 [Pirellulaceae bacterium]|nr:hypothetical protein [Pirellulaceae bacterium]